MKENFHYNCLLYFWFTFSTLIICVNCVSLQTINANIKSQEVLNHLSINKTGVVIHNMNCTGRLLDGFTYHKNCTVEVSSTEKPKITDSEISDLTKHPLRTTTLKLSTNVSSTVPTTPKTSALELDVIEKPQEYVHPNSKFNLTTGGIAALICTTAALSFYMGVMMWKRIVMNAYQNREILLNDEDIGDINDEDMRHFELKFLDKDGRVVESSNGTV